MEKVKVGIFTEKYEVRSVFNITVFFFIFLTVLSAFILYMLTECQIPYKADSNSDSDSDSDYRKVRKVSGLILPSCVWTLYPFPSTLLV